MNLWSEVVRGEVDPLLTVHADDQDAPYDEADCKDRLGNHEKAIFPIEVALEVSDDDGVEECERRYLQHSRHGEERRLRQVVRLGLLCVVVGATVSLVSVVNEVSITKDTEADEE